MINRHLVNLWRQMKIHRILIYVFLHQIGCIYYCFYAKSSSPAVQIRHSKVYGNHYCPLLVFNSPCFTLYTLLCTVYSVQYSKVSRNHYKDRLCLGSDYTILQGQIFPYYYILGEVYYKQITSDYRIITSRGHLELRN